MVLALIDGGIVFPTCSSEYSSELCLAYSDVHWRGLLLGACMPERGLIRCVLLSDIRGTPTPRFLEPWNLEASSPDEPLNLEIHMARTQVLSFMWLRTAGAVGDSIVMHQLWHLTRWNCAFQHTILELYRRIKETS